MRTYGVIFRPWRDSDVGGTGSSSELLGLDVLSASRRCAQEDGRL
jgi:hypothetical protein